jgi:hypothetical protein
VGALGSLVLVGLTCWPNGPFTMRESQHDYRGCFTPIFLYIVCEG